MSVLQLRRVGPPSRRAGRLRHAQDLKAEPRREILAIRRQFGDAPASTRYRRLLADSTLRTDGIKLPGVGTQLSVMHLAEFAGLFAAAFLAATIFPFQSEAVLAGMVLAERNPVWLLVAIASFGNVLGSIVNWCLGRFIARFEGRRWFPVKREQVAKAEVWYRRYGRWSLLLSWVPVIGDPLTVVADLLREPLPVFVVLVTLAKVGRYVVVAMLAHAWVQS